MKRIFINTDFTRLKNNIIGVIDNYFGIELLSDLSRVLYYNQVNGTFQTDKCESNIVLIKDEIDNFDFSGFGINENDYLLHHSRPENFGVNEFNSKRKKGMHEINDPVYTPVFDIIFDIIPNTEKANKIIDFLFPKEEVILEAKLELLHNCLAFTTAPILDPVLVEKYKIQFQSFLVAVKGLNTDGTEAKHIEALTDLRKALLGS